VLQLQLCGQLLLDAVMVMTSCLYNIVDSRVRVVYR
jgi:hypothetical protein